MQLLLEGRLEKIETQFYLGISIFYKKIRKEEYRCTFLVTENTRCLDEKILLNITITSQGIDRAKLLTYFIGGFNQGSVQSKMK